MKKNILLLALVFSTVAAFCQNNNYLHNGAIGSPQSKDTVKKDAKFLYGPVKFRELKETVGETYIVLPLPQWVKKYGYSIYKGEISNNRNIDTLEGPGKLFILREIDDNVARFRDSKDELYTIELLKGYIPGVAPVYDIDEARKLFLNKTLWMNQDFIKIQDAEGKEQEVKGLRFEPVKVVNVVGSERSVHPIRFIVQTPKNETGFADVIVSGTNYNLQYLLQYMFENIFYTKDPKITYKFTPAMWAKIKNHEVEIGMTKDQVFLSRGRPTKVNNSTGGGGMADQWVYGDNTYFYFRNGKLATIQN
ncbi:MAG: hypothetical protein EOP46_05060 [Sphingobacteriaceae bacterium]|nr:MAG: hypothetical protein EOP46_05060 [Sphingobacteriaceae bacterium]